MRYLPGLIIGTLLFLTALPSLALDRGDLTTIGPMTAPALPGKGLHAVEPLYNTDILQVTDATVDAGGSISDYSSWPQFNCDGTILKLYKITAASRYRVYIDRTTFTSEVGANFPDATLGLLSSDWERAAWDMNGAPDSCTRSGHIYVNISASAIDAGAFGPGVYDYRAMDSRAKTITNATNADPIVITTSTAHAYETGDTVVIADVTGNTNANGTKTNITRISDTSYSISSVGNGAYAGGGTSTGKDRATNLLTCAGAAAPSGCNGLTTAPIYADLLAIPITITAADTDDMTFTWTDPLPDATAPDFVRFQRVAITSPCSEFQVVSSITVRGSNTMTVHFDTPFSCTPDLGAALLKPAGFPHDMTSDASGRYLSWIHPQYSGSGGRRILTLDRNDMSLTRCYLTQAQVLGNGGADELHMIWTPATPLLEIEDNAGGAPTGGILNPITCAFTSYVGMGPTGHHSPLVNNKVALVGTDTPAPGYRVATYDATNPSAAKTNLILQGSRNGKRAWNMNYYVSGNNLSADALMTSGYNAGVIAGVTLHSGVIYKKTNWIGQSAANAQSLPCASTTFVHLLTQLTCAGAGVFATDDEAITAVTNAGAGSWAYSTAGTDTLFVRGVADADMSAAGQRLYFFDHMPYVDEVSIAYYSSGNENDTKRLCRMGAFDAGRSYAFVPKPAINAQGDMVVFGSNYFGSFAGPQVFICSVNGVATPPADLATPTGFRITSPSTWPMVSLIWTPNTDATLSGYTLFRGTVSGSLTAIKTVTPATSLTTHMPLTTWHDVPPIAGTYYYAVTAIDGSGQSALSSEVSVTVTCAGSRQRCSGP